MSAKRYFQALNDYIFGADQSMAAEDLYRLYGFANGIFEGIFDKKAPGATSQRIEGHDHTDSTVSGYQGGRPLARNVCYFGFKGENLACFAASPSAASAWTVMDEDWSTVYRRSSNTAGELFRTYISAGWDSVGSGTPSSPPYLKARVFLYWTPTSASVEWDVRVKNVNTSRYSSTVTITSSSTSLHAQWIDIDFVPTVDGWSGFDVECQRRNGGTSDKLEVYQFILWEDIDSGTIGNGTYALGMP